MQRAHTCPPLDRQPLYPEVVAFGAPRGMRSRLRSMAEQAGIPVSELIRRALVPLVSEPAGQPRTIEVADLERRLRAIEEEARHEARP